MTGPLSRLPAGAKLATLFVAGIGLYLIDSWPLLLAVLLGAVVALASTGVGIRRLVRPIGGLMIVAAAVLIMTGFGTGWAAGVIADLRLTSLCLLAYAVSLSTSFGDLLDVVATVLRPTARLGLDPERISLALSLTIRFIPQIRDSYLQVREAQYARGLQHRPLATMVPLVVRTLQSAEQIADAIDARCYDSRRVTPSPDRPPRRPR